MLASCPFGVPMPNPRKRAGNAKAERTTSPPLGQRPHPPATVARSRPGVTISALKDEDMGIRSLVKEESQDGSGMPCNGDFPHVWSPSGHRFYFSSASAGRYWGQERKRRFKIISHKTDIDGPDVTIKQCSVRPPVLLPT